MSKKPIDQPEPPAELTRLRELEHELKDLLRRREQTAGLLEQARQALEHARRRRAGLGHVIGSDLLDEVRETQRKAEEEVRRLEEDVADMDAGMQALKRMIVEQEPIARRACMAWWRERKQALVERIKPLADELRPLLGDLYQATEGETLSPVPHEQFARTVLLPLLFDGRSDPPAGSVEDVPVTKLRLESSLVTDDERRTLRELAHLEAAPEPAPEAAPDGWASFNDASRRISRSLGINAVSARTVLSRALDSERLPFKKYLGKTVVSLDRLDAFIEELRSERKAGAA